MIVVVTMCRDYFMAEQSERINAGTQSSYLLLLLNSQSCLCGYPIQSNSRQQTDNHLEELI